MIVQTEGIVLKSFDFRETSRIATFFTKDHGKVKGVLKGIRKDHKKFLKCAYATDVLAFETGDIIVSVDAAIKNAKHFKADLNRELVLYMIHGLLHLLGYDDHHQKDILLMRKKEAELLKKVGRLIPNAFIS